MYERVKKIGVESYHYYSLRAACDSLSYNIDSLPISIKILLENYLRKSNGDEKCLADILDYTNNTGKPIEFYPSRVLMQDFTGVPAIVDLATMRNAMEDIGKDAMRINPLVPVDLVIDHSVQVDSFGQKNSLDKNVKIEMYRNIERYKFLNWGQKSFNNLRIVPPGTGICHQVNIEYLANVVTLSKDNLLYPDTLVGTDSHTTMVNGLGVLGWGVGGIEAESVMLGQPISIVIPEVIGVKLEKSLKPGITATDLVLYITHILRTKKVVGKFVEFYGDGLDSLSLADRATIANMAPECGSTCNLFPIDEHTLEYLELTGRARDKIKIVEEYAKEQGMWHNKNCDIKFTDTVEVDLSSIEHSLAGPKRPQDNVLLHKVPESFYSTVNKKIDNTKDELRDGAIVIAAITSCTNTSNPDVMIAAGLVAKKAVELGIKPKSWVKTSLAPGSQVVDAYLRRSGLYKYLEGIGFHIVGFGCTTCIGNSGPLIPDVAEKVNENDMIVASVLSGNRNFEGRISQLVKANYLASPPLVVAYALSGFIDKDITKDPIATDKDGKLVYLADIMPNNSEIAKIVSEHINQDIFKEKYSDVFLGRAEWRSIEMPSSTVYSWDEDSTYVRRPNFFDNLNSFALSDISDARIILTLGDSVTTDHISPAGQIAKNSAAGQFLKMKGINEEDFNSYGSRRGNHEVMVRGTFANIRIRNLMLGGQVEGGYTRMHDDPTVKTVYDIATEYAKSSIPLVVFAGEEYGTGSSRDWAAKGTMLLGIKAVIAKSFERIHRSNLVGMGVLPFIILDKNFDSSLLTGDEKINIHFEAHSIQIYFKCKCDITNPDGTILTIELQADIRTQSEIDYLKDGGILRHVIKKLST
ncbi:aconitate hydratase AcnA [Anaplasmataceae bacterium AB001_6]|nr:aconitate hydratase AcnA [Anaplasmataceae bacterium AB001_6]